MCACVRVCVCVCVCVCARRMLALKSDDLFCHTQKQVAQLINSLKPDLLVEIVGWYLEYRGGGRNKNKLLAGIKNEAGAL